MLGALRAGAAASRWRAPITRSTPPSSRRRRGRGRRSARRRRGRGRDRQRGRQRPGGDRHAAVVPARRLHERLRPHRRRARPARRRDRSSSPPTSPPRACDAMTTGTVDGRHFLFMSGHRRDRGDDAPRRRPARAARPARRRLRRRRRRRRARRGRPRAAAAPASSRPAATARRGGHRDHPALRPAHLLRRRARSASARPRRSGDGTLSIAFADRAAPRDVAGIFWRLLSGDAGRVTESPARDRARATSPSSPCPSPDGRSFGIEVDGTYVGDATAVAVRRRARFAARRTRLSPGAAPVG